MLRADDASSLSLLFHLNSEPWVNPSASETPYEVEYKQSGGPAVALPAPQDTSLSRLLASRRSCRAFAPRPLPFATLSTLLKGAYGITRTERLPGVGPVHLRGVPSAGALFPLEVYVLAQHVDSLDPGLFHYNVLNHALEALRGPAQPGELASVLADQHYFDSAGAVFFLTAVFSRTQTKYGPRGYRHLLLEAGHIGQSLCLLAAEAGLASLCIGGFPDSRLNAFLGVDGLREAAVYTIGAGHPS